MDVGEELAVGTGVGVVAVDRGVGDAGGGIVAEAVALGAGVGDSVDVGQDVAVGIAVGDGVAVGEEVGEGVGVDAGVCVAVGVAVGDTVAVGVAVGNSVGVGSGRRSSVADRWNRLPGLSAVMANSEMPEDTASKRTTAPTSLTTLVGSTAHVSLYLSKAMSSTEYPLD